jgi:hypothetical protein
MYIGVTPAASDQTSFTLTNQIFHKAVRTLEMTLAACKYFFTFHLADYTLGDISNDARHHQIENCKTFLTYSKLLHLNLQRLATIRTRLLGRLGILPRQLHHSSIRKTVFLSLTTPNSNPYRTTCRASRSLPSSLLPSLVPLSRVASSQSKIPTDNTTSSPLPLHIFCGFRFPHDVHGALQLPLQSHPAIEAHLASCTIPETITTHPPATPCFTNKAGWSHREHSTSPVVRWCLHLSRSPQRLCINTIAEVANKTPARILNVGLDGAFSDSLNNEKQTEIANISYRVDGQREVFGLFARPGSGASRKPSKF